MVLGQWTRQIHSISGRRCTQHQTTEVRRGDAEDRLRRDFPPRCWCPLRTSAYLRGECVRSRLFLLS